MKFSARKDSRKRELHKKYEVDKNIIKALSFENPRNRGFKTQSLIKSFSKHRIKNRCSLTSRAKGNLSFFKLSRMMFKTKASFGFLEGIKRSSW